MKKFVLPQDKNPPMISTRSALDEVLRNGAKKLLQEAIEIEVAEYVRGFQELKDDMNRRLVTKNGYLPERDILTGLGSVNIRQPRVRDRGKMHPSQAKFCPNISGEHRVLKQQSPNYTCVASRQITSLKRLLPF